MPASVAVAIIGCGSIGAQHAAILAEMDGVRCAAFCDTIPDRAEELRQRCAGAVAGTVAVAVTGTRASAYATTDADRVLGDPGIDAVLICTQHDSHAQLALAAASAGKHVLVEKPLAMNAADCLAIGAAVDAAGVILMPAFKFRFYPLVEEFRAAMPAPLFFIAQLSDRRWPDAFWANDPVRGGGSVFSQGCHLADLLCHLAGDAVIRVHAEGGNLAHPGIAAVDAAAATLRFRRGACASLAIGDLGPAPLVSKFSIQAFDGSGSAHLHARCTRLLLDGEDGTRELMRDTEEGLVLEDAAFVEAVRRGGPSPISWRDGHRAVALIEAVMASLRSGEQRMVAALQ